MTGIICIFWTCQNEKEAKSIISDLLEKRLIACASIIPNITSLYVWKDKVEEGKEVKVIIKTKSDHFSTISKHIRKKGSYEVPEILQVEVSDGNPDYLSWVLNETN